MLARNLFDEAARVLAMPIPRRKALKYLATGLVGAMLPFFWPKEATARDVDWSCQFCPGHCTSTGGCLGRRVDDPCTIGGKAGHCAKQLVCQTRVCCHCVLGPPPDAPQISDIPDVAITREDSLAAGNCLEGTDRVASWFSGRESVPAREAAQAAIARGRPRLARYIARTALLVHRGAQV